MKTWYISQFKLQALDAAVWHPSSPTYCRLNWLHSSDELNSCCICTNKGLSYWITAWCVCGLKYNVWDSTYTLYTFVFTCVCVCPAIFRYEGPRQRCEGSSSSLANRRYRCVTAPSFQILSRCPGGCYGYVIAFDVCATPETTMTRTQFISILNLMSYSTRSSLAADFTKADVSCAASCR